jgi:hypothetical protein
MFLLYFMLFLLQNQRTGEWNRFCPGGGEGREERAQIMYTHASKCKNDRIK